MWLVRFVMFSMSVLDSFQVGTSDIKKMLPQQFLKAKRQITPHPDAGLNIYQVLQKYGYPVETHTVTSEDGYILRMQRIPRGRDETDSGKIRPAILLVHGMLGSGADWLLMGPNRSLAYMLADAGFDVWLGNTRGNTWSRRHVHLDPDVDVEKFWDFRYYYPKQYIPMT